MEERREVAGRPLVEGRDILEWWKLEENFQLVAQRASSKGENVGSPVFQRKMPESCQPPRAAWAMPLASLRKALPLAKGICHTAEALTLCLTSKSELA